MKHLARIAAAAVLGHRERLRGLLQSALDDGVEGAVLQEATLQVFLFAGYPRAIDAFEELRALVDTPPPSEPAGDYEARGRELFARIYGDRAGTVEEWLRDLHPDFARFTLQHAYGQVMTRPFLPARERELMAVAMLAALGFKGQLQAHVRGALHCGAIPDDVREAAADYPGSSELIEKTLASAGG